MQPAVLLTIYCAVIVAGSLAGGFVPLLLHLTHRRMQIAISFVSGVILGIGLLHLLPHGYLALDSIDKAMGWMLAGFLFMFFLERFFSFHHHDVADDEAAALHAAQDAMHSLAHDHEAHQGHDHGHAHAHQHGTTGPSAISWLGATTGLSLHGLIDGVALAAAVQASAAEPEVQWAGLGTAIAIALHKPFDSLTIGTLLAAADQPRPRRQLINLLYSLITPLGVLVFYFISRGAGHANGLGETLCFAAGAFVCIATSDLLPELHFHRHDRLGLSIALLMGIGFAWGTMFLESGHEHSHVEHTHEHEHDAK